MLKVFISHAKEDRGRALEIRDGLKAAGFDIWFDEDNLLGLERGKVIRRDITEDLSQYNFDDQILGLKIQQWGFHQPLVTNGKKMIEKQYRHHLQAYRHNGGNSLLGVYYIHLIYLTEKAIYISGFFFDFILSKTFGPITKQYYYKDIVSVGTMVTDVQTMTDQEEQETKLLLLRFYNNEEIRIALTDEVTVENLREQINAQRLQEAENLDERLLAEPDEQNTLDLEKLFDLSLDRLPGTRANFMVNNIRNFWNVRKDDTLPPNFTHDSLT